LPKTLPVCPRRGTKDPKLKQTLTQTTVAAEKDLISPLFEHLFAPNSTQPLLARNEEQVDKAEP